MRKFFISCFWVIVIFNSCSTCNDSGYVGPDFHTSDITLYRKGDSLKIRESNEYVARDTIIKVDSTRADSTIYSPYDTVVLSGRRDTFGTVVGKFAFDIPSEMEVGDRIKVTVLITASQEKVVLFDRMSTEEIRRFSPSSNIEVSPKMSVELTDPSNGKNFDIKKRVNNPQPVDSLSNTTWVWDVLPLESGKNALDVDVFTHNDANSQKYFNVLHQTVYVESSYMYSIREFLGKNWQWIATAIVIPLIVWLYSLRKKSQTPPSMPIATAETVNINTEKKKKKKKK